MVYRFPNGACMSTSAGKNGTCYAQDECDNKGGKGYGSCAGGYGVCCVCKRMFFIVFKLMEFNHNFYFHMILRWYKIEIFL